MKQTAARLLALEQAVLGTLVYFHLFRFPLTVEEAVRLTGHEASRSDLEGAVESLEGYGLVGREGEYLYLGDRDDVSLRKAAEARATSLEQRILARARLIGRFPFVRGVGLSGSASKGILKPGDDVDFFVVTAPGRLWLCRTLLMVFKRLVLLNSHRMFCVNYLIAEDRLTLPDRNVFTAMEIAWLRPVWGEGWYRAFLEANAWVRDFLPNWTTSDPRGAESARVPPRAWMERAFAGVLGNRLDAWLRSLITRRNRRKYRHLTTEEFSVAFRSEPHVSKHHPGHHQGRVTARFESTQRDWLERLDRARSSPARIPT